MMPYCNNDTRPSTVYVATAIRTCETSAYLFNQALTFLKANGYGISEQPSEADIFLFNTCSVTKGQTERCESRIEDIIKNENPKMLIVFGCLAKTTKKYRENDKILFVGPKETSRLNQIFPHTIPIEQVTQPKIDNTIFKPYQSNLTNKDYYIILCQGCVNRCTYCNIKNAKGDVLSKKKGNVISEIREGLEKGFTEFTFVGDDCGSYGFDRGTDLAELTKELLALDERICLKFNSFSPGNFISLYPRLRESLKTKRITYLNLPIQSASPRILKLMNRNYSIPELSEIIRDLRAISPGTWLYTHILINFPTETRKEFIDSLKTSLLFDERIIMSYIDNPGTPANNITPKVEEKEKKYRLTLGGIFLKTRKIKGFVMRNERD